MRSDLYLKWDLYAGTDIVYSRYVRTSGPYGLGVFLNCAVALTINEGRAMDGEDLVYSVMASTFYPQEEVQKCIDKAVELGLLKVDEEGLIYSSRVQKDIAEQLEKRGKQRANANARWHKETSQCDGNATAIPMQAMPIDATKTKTKTKTDIKEPLLKESQEKVAKAPSVCFRRPSLFEVEAYCAERNNGVDAGAFFDFYEAKGWKVGNQSMKDWKACVRTWEKRTDSRKMVTSPEDRAIGVNPDGSLNLRGAL